jgi:hypothetical protein
MTAACARPFSFRGRAHGIASGTAIVGTRWPPHGFRAAAGRVQVPRRGKMRLFPLKIPRRTIGAVAAMERDNE